MRGLRLVLPLLFVAVACNGPGPQDVGLSPTPTPVGTPLPDLAGHPTVEITEPQDGARLSPGPVRVSVRVEDFELADLIGRPPGHNQGHIHYYRDVPQQDLPTDPARPAVPEDADAVEVTAESSHTWQDVERGLRVFCVQLVDNDHSALDPAVVDCVTVSLQ